MFGRKKEELFGGNVDPKCDYCIYCSDSGPGIPCRLGKKPKDGEICDRYSYDPLRRNPVNLPPLKKHDPEEFKL